MSRSSTIADFDDRPHDDRLTHWEGTFGQFAGIPFDAQVVAVGQAFEIVGVQRDCPASHRPGDVATQPHQLE